MPVKFKIAQKEKYTWTWPEKIPADDGSYKDVPEEDRLKLHMKLLTDSDIESIENNQFRAMMTGKMAKEVEGQKSLGDEDEMAVQFQGGTTGRIKVNKAVIGWENVEDESGTSIPFKKEIFSRFLRANGNFPMDSEGEPNLRDDLISHIDERNGLGKNPTVKVNSKS